MAEILNLNKARKQRKKAANIVNSASNRTKFGRNKIKKSQDSDENRKVGHILDNSKLEPEDGA